MPAFRAQPHLKELPPPEAEPPAHDMDYLTNFERKFRKQEKPIWRAVFVKQD
jgi:tRNA (guanine-N7-)-methyltransferase